jgi:hypothetical protein
VIALDALVREPKYDRSTAVFNEGYLSVAVPPYPIPYRSLTPRPEVADNLLVDVAARQEGQVLAL